LSDGLAIEILIEHYYQKLRNLENPLIDTRTLYPFKTNLALSDPSAIYSLHFFVLRPFFNPHSSIMIIILFNIFLTQIGMYFLLRRYRISDIIALCFSLIYAFTPFIANRIAEHYTYTALYVFPWSYLTVFHFLKAKKITDKLLFSAIFSCLLTITLFSNFYYFFIIISGILSFILFFYLTRRPMIVDFFVQNKQYIGISIVIFILLLTPWLKMVWDIVYYQEIVDTPGFGGAIHLSGDVISLVTPSDQNPFYSYLIRSMSIALLPFGNFKNFFFSSGEHFAYPGIIIIFVYFYILFKKFKMYSGIKNVIISHFIVSLFFLVLVLGPFLKIFNIWKFALDDAVNVIVPLPFFIFHYLPGLQMLRDPSRLLPGFVFLACFVSALLFNRFYLKSHKKFLFIIAILMVFFLDQFYIITPRLVQKVPLKIYDYIKKDPEKTTVLEIPFNVRDGFQYIGFVHSRLPIYGTIIHNKPVVGGYFARIPDDVFNYYKNLPFIGYVAKITDGGNYNPYTQFPRYSAIVPFNNDIRLAEKELNFLNIKYMILKTDERYTSNILDIIKRAGYMSIIQDGDYALFAKKLKKEDFYNIKFGNKEDFLYTASGFSDKEDDFRWSLGKTSKVLIKTFNPDKKYLSFEIEAFYKPQTVKIYLNNDYVGSQVVEVKKKIYHQSIVNKLNPDINTVTFRYSHVYKPKDVLPGNLDERKLSVKFYSIKLD